MTSAVRDGLKRGVEAVAQVRRDADAYLLRSSLVFIFGRLRRDYPQVQQWRDIEARLVQEAFK